MSDENKTLIRRYIEAIDTNPSSDWSVIDPVRGGGLRGAQSANPRRNTRPERIDVQSPVANRSPMPKNVDMVDRA
jgi:hypothetical protein